MSREPGPRGVVDQARPLFAEVLERVLDVVDAVGDVVDAGTSTGQRAPDGGLGPERAEQLDERRADPEQDLLHPLVVDALAMRGLDAEEAPILLDRPFQVLDRDADVVDLGEPDHRPPRTAGCILPISSRAATTW